MWLFQTICENIRDILTIEDPRWNRSISLAPRELLGKYVLDIITSLHITTLFLYYIIITIQCAIILHYTGSYLDRKWVTGQKPDDLIFKRFVEDYPELKWQPPLANHGLILPRE